MGGGAPAVPRAIEPPRECLPPMGLDLFDWAKGFPANRKSPRVRTREYRDGDGHESDFEQVRHSLMKRSPGYFDELSPLSYRPSTKCFHPSASPVTPAT